MKCTECSGSLEVLRSCGSVQMRCGECGKKYTIRDIADQLDYRTEKILERYNAIIYD